MELKFGAGTGAGGGRRQDDKNYHLIGSRPAVATQRRRSKWDKHLIYGSAYAEWSCANEDPLTARSKQRHTTPRQVRLIQKEGNPSGAKPLRNICSADL